MNDLRELIRRNLQNDKVVKYFNIVRKGTADPEQNFKDGFFSPLLESLGFPLGSEIHLTKGRIDYAYMVRDFGVGFEIKPPIFKRQASEPTPEDALPRHFLQVIEYLSDPRLHYVALTDGFHWYFFSKSSARRSSQPFFLTLSGETLFREGGRKKIQDLRWDRIADTLRRWEDESQREPLEERFFKDLETWVSILEKDLPGENVAKLITLINRFVFVRTLEDIVVLPRNHLQDEMDRLFSKWGEQVGAKKFVEEIREFIYSLYDTELFNPSPPLPAPTATTLSTIIYGKPIEGNLFPPFLYEFRFTEMDFDVLGHVYERYLAELRAERGIFYTMRFVVDYILDNTLGRGINQVVSEAKKALEKDDLSREDFEASREAIKAIFDLRVLDPACGSGSFLVRAFEMLMRGFEDWEGFYREKVNAHPEAFSNFFRPLENSAPVSEELKDWRQRLLLSCIHGVDLDARACEVAKMNLWLTLIKSEPDRYWWESIRSMNLSYVLPDLSLNIVRGNSLVSLGIEETERILSEEFSEDMERIKNLRSLYQSNYRLQREAAEEIKGIKDNIRRQLMQRLRARLEDLLAKQDKVESNWLKKMGEARAREILSETLKGQEIESAVFWPLEFPFRFRYVVGNPPYIGEEDHKEIFRPVAACPLMGPFYMGKMDYWYFFVHLGLRLLEEGGELSMITSSYWRAAAGAKNLRKDIMEKADILDYVDFVKFMVFRESAPGVNNNIFRLRVPKEGARTQVIEVQDHRLSEKDMVRALAGKKVAGTRRWTAPPIFSGTAISFHPAETEELLEQMEKAEANLADLVRIEIPRKGKEPRVLELISAGIQESPAQVTRKALAKMLGKEQPTDEEIKAKERELGFRVGDGVFVLSEMEKGALKLIPEEEDRLKPYYSGSELGRFYAPEKNRSWVIYTDRRLAKELENSPEKMPNITEHLDKFRPIITSNNKPYGLHCSRNEIYFTSPRKIITVGLVGYPVFVHVEKPCYVGFDCYSMVLKEDCPVSPEALSAILNSSLAWFWMYYRGKRRGGDNLQIVIKNLKAFPVALPDKKTDRRLSELAREIGRLKGAKERLLALWKQGADNLPGPRIPLAEFLRERMILTRTKTLADGTPVRGLKTGFDEKENAVIVGSGIYAFGDKGTALFALYALDCWLRQTRKKTWGAFCKEVSLATEGLDKLVKELGTEARKLGVPVNIVEVRELIRDASREIDEIVSTLYGISVPEDFRIWEVEDAI